MSTFAPKSPISCYRLLTELERLPLSDRYTFDSIILPRNLMFSDDGENHVASALRLATFLLAWKQLEVITIAMPDDLNAADKESDDYDYWSWALHRPLLAAFVQGRWRELRLLHPQRYLDTSVFLFHNMHYLEDWILPAEPRHQLETRRQRHSECASDWARNGGQSTKFPQSVDARPALDADCEQIWASRGMICQREDPAPNESGTVIAVRWRESWMKEDRRKAAQANPADLLDHPDGLPWKYWSSIRLPPFLQLLQPWRVILCKTHGSCFARDTLQHHLICHHGATEDEAIDVACFSPAEHLAETWDDIVHPYDRIQPIPYLPVINAYSCSVASCQYRTVTMRDLFKHSQEFDHLNILPEPSVFQTLSSNQAELRLFKVFSPDDFLFPLR